MVMIRENLNILRKDTDAIIIEGLTL